MSYLNEIIVVTANQVNQNDSNTESIITYLKYWVDQAI